MPTGRNIKLEDAGPTVADVMLAAPRTYPASTPLGDAAAEFENPRVRLLLVTDGDRYVGGVTREQVAAAERDPERPIAEVAGGAVPQVAPGDTPAHALEVVEESGSNRIPVVDDDGNLLGLVCWNKQGWFCA
jgi:CBS domain-containing protein